MDSSKAQVQVHHDDHDMAVQAHGNELKRRRADSFRKIWYLYFFFFCFSYLSCVVYPS